MDKKQQQPTQRPNNPARKEPSKTNPAAPSRDSHLKR